MALIIEQIIFMSIILLAFIAFVYVHVVYPFWSHMPVSRPYHFWHRNHFNNGSSIEKIPYRNKFCDTLQVRTFNYYDMTTTKKQEFADLLNCHYLPSDSILFTMDIAKFDTLFQGHFLSPYFSVYCINPLFAPKNTEMVNVPLGCISSWPLHMQYKNKSNILKQSIHNIQYLAVNERALSASKNKEVTRTLIATHVFQCRRKTPLLPFLYKKHVGKCAGIKPFICFSTYLYLIEFANASMLAPIQIYKANWSYLYECLELIYGLYDFVAHIDMGALKARVDAEHLWIYMLRHKGTILGLYFIEDAMMLYENIGTSVETQTNMPSGGKTLNLMASMMNMEKTPENLAAFRQGFMDSVCRIQEQNKDYMMILMDSVGDNRLLAKAFSKRPIKKTRGTYYLINAECSGEPVKNAFIVG